MQRTVKISSFKLRLLCVEYAQELTLAGIAGTAEVFTYCLGMISWKLIRASAIAVRSVSFVMAHR